MQKIEPDLNSSVLILSEQIGDITLYNEPSNLDNFLRGFKVVS